MTTVGFQLLVLVVALLAVTTPTDASTLTTTSWSLSNYSVVANPPFELVNIQATGNRNVRQINSSILGNDNTFSDFVVQAGFTFPLGDLIFNTSQFFLNANGFFYFLESNPLGQKIYIPVCPLSSYSSDEYAFSFYWTDLDFSNGGSAYYAFFEGGSSNSCPYSQKSAEPCLVVAFENATMYDGSPVGNIEAVLFASGDMLSQVHLFPNAEWGDAKESLGVGFGAIGASGYSIDYPNASCPWVHPGFSTSFAKPGSSFSFLIVAPCGEGKVKRTDGLGCQCSNGSLAFAPVTGECQPCPYSQISDGMSCLDCPTGKVPNPQQTGCIVSHTSTTSTTASTSSNSNSNKAATLQNWLFWISL